MRRATLVGGLCLAATIGVPAVQAVDAPSEQQVKAAYLFNFARYVDWPAAAYASSTDPLRICVLGDDDFLEVAKTSVGDREIDARPVAVERRADVSSSASCHILFISEHRRGVERDVIDSLSGKSVFTVSDSDDFAKSGGVANFVLVDNKVRFEINRGSAERAGLKLSSKLLRIAQVVE